MNPTRPVLGLLVGLLTAFSFVPAPASAAGTINCVIVMDVFFSPALNLNAQTGTETDFGTSTCPFVLAPCGAILFCGDAPTFSYGPLSRGYVGDCIHATLENGVQLWGGNQFTGVFTGPGVVVEFYGTLVSDNLNPCDMSHGTCVCILRADFI